MISLKTEVEIMVRHQLFNNRHRHQLNVHCFPRLIKGMDGCFPTAYIRRVDNQPLATLRICRLVIATLLLLEILFSHHKVVVYPWECWSKFLLFLTPTNYD